MNDGLLLRAASCYVRSGWLPEACRCFGLAGHHAEAARLYESCQLWDEAALAYTQAGDWRAAARCHLRAGRPEPAADCLLQAGDLLEAAWVLADGLSRFGRARALAETVQPASDLQAVGRELVLARCEAAGKDPRPAAKRLRQAIDQLGRLPVEPVRDHIGERMLAVAGALDRPDLAALVHAAATRAGVPGAVERWESWASQTLGDASGVPAAAETAYRLEPKIENG